MLRRLYSSRKMMMMALAASLLLVLGWFSAGTSFAEGHYAKPLINGKWYKIEPGEVQWFAFEYEVRYEEVEGDDDDDDDDDEKEFEIERPRVFVWMNTKPSHDHINFAIWSPDRLQRLRDEMGDEVEAPPLGRGSADDDDDNNTPGDYFWAGEYHENATIYVAVENKGTQTKYYSLHKEIEQ